MLFILGNFPPLNETPRDIPIPGGLKRVFPRRGILEMATGI